MTWSTEFAPSAPNRLWVADFTYVSTWAGWVYVAFVIDAYARRILGWRTATTMTTELVLDAIEQAIWTRKQDNHDQFDELVAHNDRGVQYLSVAYSERLARRASSRRSVRSAPVMTMLSQRPSTASTRPN